MDFRITFLNGLSLGGVYALIALGYTMVYGIAKMLNFAHGDIIMVGGYVLFVFVGLTGEPILAIINISYDQSMGCSCWLYCSIIICRTCNNHILPSNL